MEKPTRFTQTIKMGGKKEIKTRKIASLVFITICSVHSNWTSIKTCIKPTILITCELFEVRYLSTKCIASTQQTSDWQFTFQKFSQASNHIYNSLDWWKHTHIYKTKQRSHKKTQVIWSGTAGKANEEANNIISINNGDISKEWCVVNPFLGIQYTSEHKRLKY